MDNIFVGILGFGGLAALAYYLTSGNAGKILQKLHEIFQKEKQEEIKEIETKQKETEKIIIDLEKASEESKEKIKKIQKESTKEIVKILAEEDIKILDEKVDELWKN